MISRSAMLIWTIAERSSPPAGASGPFSHRQDGGLGEASRGGRSSGGAKGLEQAAGRGGRGGLQGLHVALERLDPDGHGGVGAEGAL